MNKFKYLQIISFVFCLFLGSNLAFGERKPRVSAALVHSYSADYTWTQQVENGFLERLNEDYQVEVVGKFHLDSKKHPEKLVSEAEKINLELSKLKFDILFVSDDDALDLVGKKYF